MLGTFKVLLYGEEKKITRKSGRLSEYIEEILGEDPEFYYFGDLDYEGISTYQVSKLENPEVEINLLVEAMKRHLSVKLLLDEKENSSDRVMINVRPNNT